MYTARRSGWFIQPRGQRVWRQLRSLWRITDRAVRPAVEQGLAYHYRAKDGFSAIACNWGNIEAGTMQPVMMAAATLDRNSPENRLRSVASASWPAGMRLTRTATDGGFAAADDWLWRMP
jgi:hypothetical protein